MRDFRGVTQIGDRDPDPLQSSTPQAEVEVEVKAEKRPTAGPRKEVGNPNSMVDTLAGNHSGQPALRGDSRT